MSHDPLQVRRSTSPKRPHSAPLESGVDSLVARLEPQVLFMFDPSGAVMPAFPRNNENIDSLSQLSIAISLKRIADALQPQKEARKAPPIELDPVLNAERN